MKKTNQKQEKERQMYDTKERLQRIENAKKKVEEGDTLVHKLRDIFDEREREKISEKALERYRSAINEMLANKTSNSGPGKIHR